jgi:hypothetical protein
VQQVRVDPGFRHKGLRRLYEDDDPSGLPAGAIGKLRATLAPLEFGPQVATLPGWNLHPLKGERSGKLRDRRDAQLAPDIPDTRQRRDGGRLRGLPLRILCDADEEPAASG